MALTEAQKRAQKKYSKKVINFSVSYKQSDIAEGKRLKRHLSDTKQSANSYIKKLIKEDLDSKNVEYDNE